MEMVHRQAVRERWFCKNPTVRALVGDFVPGLCRPRSAVCYATCLKPPLRSVSSRSCGGWASSAPRCRVRGAAFGP
eukprot:5643463-Amphidinium_carterae.1